MEITFTILQKRNLGKSWRTDQVYSTVGQEAPVSREARAVSEARQEKVAFLEVRTWTRPRDQETENPNHQTTGAADQRKNNGSSGDSSNQNKFKKHLVTLSIGTILTLTNSPYQHSRHDQGVPTPFQFF